ncbi:hypothetical protein [uncultured Leclercia sp.]|nr:hypothetical protein [uncultured Leclercia sp.]
MMIRIRVMPVCIVITAQKNRELWGFAKGLSVAPVKSKKMELCLGAFKGG